ncbi:hypothetical protein TIFTF001_043540 [Ficus carica]|uniref:Uncharacterized protein n=1 Tax=Ficus carica TaxID=3494 RepID=A0AA88CMT1_FICCA|nr:hypothetical protein TIFTF001_043539 [Ficus carica]GMN22572.1 hypothetical protein TIFTF001_043540 [Ficus carica]
MAAEREHQDDLPQGSPIIQQEASTSEAISQITNLTRLVEELTKKHNDQQSHMETITAENQILKNQLMAINSQAAYSYYYNPYVGHILQPATCERWGWQHATPYHQQRSRAPYSPINPMQPLFASEDTPPVDERQAQPRQTAPGTSSRRQTTPIRRSTPELSQSSEDLFQPGTNVEEMMRSIMSEEMRTLEAQMQQRFTSQIHKATTSTPGIDDLARGVRETPLTKRITNIITPKFSNISFPRTREELSKARDEREKNFRRERQRQQRPTEKRVERSTRQDRKRPFSPPKYALGISPSELIAHLKHQDFVTWPKKLSENPARDTSKYCEFHKDHGHNTVDCRALRAEVAELLKKGHLREFLTEKGRETYGLGGEHKERRVVQHIEDTPSPPPVRKTIGVILGGSIYSGETIVYSN